MFGKPLAFLTPDDINRLCREQVRESDVVEFKEALSAKNGRDAWHGGADRIGDLARDKIVNELIAFANAHGGTLVLGIAETRDKPARAEKVCPIQRCADLAERLSRALADTVEPPLTPFPTIVPIPTEGDAGVVAFQVAASRNAPHRHRSTRESYIRRGEQAVAMTMREIQDLTLQVERGLASLEQQFAGSARRFDDNCRQSPIKLGLRGTAIPMTPLSVDVPNDTKISPFFKQFKGTFGQREVDVSIPLSPHNFRAILRGVRATDSRSDETSVSVEIKSSGSIELIFLRPRRENLALPATWFAGLACNALSILDYIRQSAGAPGTEYGLELAVYAASQTPILAYDGDGLGGSTWNVGFVTFPRYSVRDRTQFADIVELVDRDFWNAAGLTGGPALRIRF